MRHSDIAELLKEAGLPAKDSYVRILALFAASPKKSLTATDVYRHLITDEPTVNVTSIYRIVRSLHTAALLDCDKGTGGYGGGKNMFRFAAAGTVKKTRRKTG
ncbi:MAG: transcriptional repressor [Pseudomonadota bacterium]